MSGAAAPERHTFKEAVYHYKQLRELYFELTEEEFSNFNVKLSEISLQDAKEVDCWHWDDPQRQLIWNWVSSYQACQSKNGY